MKEIENLALHFYYKGNSLTRIQILLYYSQILFFCINEDFLFSNEIKYIDGEIVIIENWDKIKTKKPKYLKNNIFELISFLNDELIHYNTIELLEKIRLELLNFDEGVLNIKNLQNSYKDNFLLSKFIEKERNH